MSMLLILFETMSRKLCRCIHGELLMHHVGCIYYLWSNIVIIMLNFLSHSDVPFNNILNDNYLLIIVYR